MPPRQNPSSRDSAAMRMSIDPRVLSRDEAAMYCGCESVSTFDSWVRKGIIPRPIPGTTKWDRRAIDDALDRFGFSAPLIQAWKAGKNADAD